MTTRTNQDWQTICQLSDLVPYAGVAAKVNGQQIALFYVPENQAVFAIDNYCPFSEANVLSRGIIGDLKGQLVVASPIYKQHFNLATGACLEDGNVRVGCYQAKIENDTISVAI